MALRNSAAACLAAWSLAAHHQADAFGLGLRPTNSLTTFAPSDVVGASDTVAARPVRGMSMYSAFKKKGGGGKKKGGGKSKTGGGGKAAPASGKGGGKGRGEGAPTKPAVDTSRKVRPKEEGTEGRDCGV